jgi:lipid II:glycine glycyltransferase (peptidoglycan interpeptide bridge formation enzyme)
VRYNAAYFRAVVELAESDPCVRCLVATRGNEIAGFVFVAQDVQTAYYLHGATHPAMRQYNPSDLLLHEAIAWARGSGMKSFNLMASPPGQSSLLRYKEKWGGTTAPQHTYELLLHPVAARLFRMISVAYSYLPRR